MKCNICPLRGIRQYCPTCINYKSGWVNWKLIVLVVLAMLVFIGIAKADMTLSQHFKKSELACKCCGETKVNIELIAALENLRQLAGKSIIVTSGYRCPSHNKANGGARHSQHQYGNAVDIRIKGYTPAQVAKLAKRCGFTWTKIYSGWTHIDVRQTQLAKGSKGGIK